MERKTQIHKLMSDVQDPSDFPAHSQAPGLRLLDTALRCTICTELFDGPVTLKCGHCFCSICIRESLVRKQECPACREEDVNEGHLRRNTVMEEAVLAWKESRPYILQLLNKDSQRTSESSRPSKKRRLDRDSDNAVAGSSVEPEIIEIPQSSDDASQSEDLVECPMCSRRVKLGNINQHMDKSCKDEPEPTHSSKSQWDNILGSKSQAAKTSKKRGKERASSSEEDSPLPKKSYDTLKDKAIRDLLQDYDLTTSGDRKALIARHQRLVIIYNANLDKSHKSRKSLNALRRDLKEWETQQKNKTKHDISDTATYQIKQKSEFDKLVEAARLKKPDSSSSHNLTPPTPNSRPKTTRESLTEEAILVDSEDEK
ncbi:hypothetical protein GYMLUDRAFT_40568 [Collybiopsis luxurians FD-317 M1]|uniref:Postreplication repair E3 ubiquitin-protein ligase RAD18 n=1 Tax=Collybiopsis luxurians FD-317 M1 TaxID=944289 RepID=A0A0D0BHU2_9AGAR|nr:hypothetical protein GYMLUDRAFT_40568 [Collybiopsis luxurians FD-317 M1]